MSDNEQDFETQFYEISNIADLTNLSADKLLNEIKPKCTFVFDLKTTDNYEKLLKEAASCYPTECRFVFYYTRNIDGTLSLILLANDATFNKAKKSLIKIADAQPVLKVYFAILQGNTFIVKISTHTIKYGLLIIETYAKSWKLSIKQTSFVKLLI
jgi:hypothetical protein